MSLLKKSVQNSAVAVAVVAVAFAGAGTASADQLTGWVAPAGSSSGYTFLSTSTIINAPQITAESKIYTVDGRTVPPAYMGVRARLFKSGALCEVVDYKYNAKAAPSLTVGTPGPGCGSGSYNSHGFVSVFNAETGYKTAVTFPSSPLDYAAPAARSTQSTQAAPESLDQSSGVNDSGQTFGAGADADTDAELPDLVLAIGDDGTVGYVASSNLTASPATPEEVLQLPIDSSGAEPVHSEPSRTVPLFDKDGVTSIGQFTIN
jgi:hypothetical protein